MSTFQAAFEALRRVVGDVEADRMLTAVEHEGARVAADKVRAEIAQDFIRQGKASTSLTWGQAHEIALNGLCSCSGGIKPCDMGAKGIAAP
jgi:hypothetical protein